MKSTPADPAQDEHVRIHPVTRFSKSSGFILVEADLANAAPRVVVVASRTPATSVNRGTPFPHLFIAVLAKAKHQIAWLLLQVLTHDFVGVNGIAIIAGIFAQRHLGRCLYFTIDDGAVTAPVIFEEIEAP